MNPMNPANYQGQWFQMVHQERGAVWHRVDKQYRQGAPKDNQYALFATCGARIDVIASVTDDRLHSSPLPTADTICVDCRKAYWDANPNPNPLLSDLCDDSDVPKDMPAAPEHLKAAAAAEEQVDHPQHYQRGLIETIDMMESLAVSWDELPKAIPAIATCLKYLDRAPHKGNLIEDLRKARWYLDRAIAVLEDE